MAGEVVGTVVRLQVQRSRLKPARAYDPAPLHEVAALDVTPRGVRGDGLLDVHHADHPDSRNRRLANGLSLLTQEHYAGLRQAFGDHLVDGVAGESVLLASDGPVALEGDLLLEVDGGELLLTDVRPTPPCVEFTRFCLQRDPGSPVDDELRAALSALGGGARGVYASTAGTGTVRPGALLRRA